MPFMLGPFAASSWDHEGFDVMDMLLFSKCVGKAVWGMQSSTFPLGKVHRRMGLGGTPGVSRGGYKRVSRFNGGLFQDAGRRPGYVFRTLRPADMN